MSRLESGRGAAPRGFTSTGGFASRDDVGTLRRPSSGLPWAPSRQPTGPPPDHAKETPPPQDRAQTAKAIEEGRRVYLGNLPYAAKTKDVEEFFKWHNVKVLKLDMSVDPFTGRNPSYAFVELESKKAAEEAMAELTGLTILDRPVILKPCLNSRRDNPSWVFNRWQRTDAEKHWEGYGDEGRRLFVAGLPRMDSQLVADGEVRKLFHEFPVEAISKVISPPETDKNKEIINKRYVFVDLPSAEIAQQAIKALDKTYRWGARIKVALCQFDSSIKIRNPENIEPARVWRATPKDEHPDELWRPAESPRSLPAERRLDEQWRPAEPPRSLELKPDAPPCNLEGVPPRNLQAERKLDEPWRAAECNLEPKPNEQPYNSDEDEEGEYVDFPV